MIDLIDIELVIDNLKKFGQFLDAALMVQEKEPECKACTLDK